MASRFYVTGGTLGIDTPSYVPRDADDELYCSLAASEFCYVLTSRQMGKSSLMVRTASRLRAESVAIAVIDLTAIGVNVTAAQWYDGLLSRLGEQLNLEAEIEQFANRHAHLSPLQCWLAAIDQIVLGQVSGNIVIFIDEIDFVRSLSFPADELFAALRQCYNRRSEDKRWQRLAFCLLGVASPSDLISDPHITPFNIGRRVDVSDFRHDEARVLTQGFAKRAVAEDHLLARVLHWTGGHPYLTQRLCEAVAADDRAQGKSDVDRICHRLFLSAGAREQDDNLVFVRERILRSDNDLASVLDLYRKVLQGRAINDDNNSRIETLKLAGVVGTHDGKLRIRNRIYRQVFDADWVHTHMPDAELRRQRAAFYQGLFRATAVAAIVIVMLGTACAIGFYQWTSTREALKSAKVSERIATNEHLRALDAAAKEKEQREIAVQREAEANRLRGVAETQQHEADDARQLADLARQDAEREKQLALESVRKMQIAYQRLSKEQRSVEAREQLFAEFPLWMQAYAADAVAQYAEQQAEGGDPLAALQTYAEFCDLALADDDGFWARELVRIEPDQLRRLNLDEDVLATRIKVRPIDIFRKVVEPAIKLGESKLDDPARERGTLLATLYDSQARLIFEHPDLDESPAASRPARIVRLYDRAIELDASRYSLYLARAVVQYIAEPKALDSIQRDLETALSSYPTAVQPPAAASDITRAHRDLALIRHSLASVLELQATVNPGHEDQLRDQAIDLFEQAHALNPQEVSYVVSVAASHRHKAAKAAVLDVDLLRTAADTLERAKNKNDSFAPLYNEAGETELLLGDLAKARQQFHLAVQFGNLNDPPSNRYRYYCNLANACSRLPTTTEQLQQALNAAAAAAKLQPKSASEAFYYRGVSLWAMSKMETTPEQQRSKRERAAVAFESALAQAPNHVGAILAKCQLRFEGSDRKVTDDEMTQLLGECERALKLARSKADVAKAHYVAGLGHFRRHLDTKAEAAFIESLTEILAAVRASRDYIELVRPYFAQSAKRAWQDRLLENKADELRGEFDQSLNP